MTPKECFARVRCQDRRWREKSSSSVIPTYVHGKCKDQLGVSLSLKYAQDEICSADSAKTNILTRGRRRWRRNSTRHQSKYVLHSSSDALDSAASGVVDLLASRSGCGAVD